jgi:hypothetical protein
MTPVRMSLPGGAGALRGEREHEESGAESPRRRPVPGRGLARH